MKKLIITLLLLLPALAFSQVSIEYPVMVSDTVTVALDSTASCSVYVLFEPLRSRHRFKASETAPTSANTISDFQTFLATGNVYISINTDTTAAEESDSLTAYIKPYVYNAQESAYAIVEKDSTWLVFDTAGTYVSTSADYLNWAHDKTYGTTLAGELWSCHGFVIIFNQYAADVTDAASRLRLNIMKVK